MNRSLSLTSIRLLPLTPAVYFWASYWHALSYPSILSSALTCKINPWIKCVFVCALHIAYLCICIYIYTHIHTNIYIFILHIRIYMLIICFMLYISKNVLYIYIIYYIFLCMCENIYDVYIDVSYIMAGIHAAGSHWVPSFPLFVYLRLYHILCTYLLNMLCFVRLSLRTGPGWGKWEACFMHRI